MLPRFEGKDSTNLRYWSPSFPFKAGFFACDLLSPENIRMNAPAMQVEQPAIRDGYLFRTYNLTDMLLPCSDGNMSTMAS